MATKPQVSGQVKPCPYRKEHEWEPESISTPREICRHCYAVKPEEEITVTLDSLKPGDLCAGTAISIVYNSPWMSYTSTPPQDLHALQKARDDAMKKLGIP